MFDFLSASFFSQVQFCISRLLQSPRKGMKTLRAFYVFHGFFLDHWSRGQNKGSLSHLHSANYLPSAEGYVHNNTTKMKLFRTSSLRQWCHIQLCSCHNRHSSIWIIAAAKVTLQARTGQCAHPDSLICQLRQSPPTAPFPHQLVS